MSSAKLVCQTNMTIKAVEFAQALIRCPSVTPRDAGALDVLSGALADMGFVCTRFPFEDVDNLYARLGTAAPNFCYAGHTDVVPVGDADAWSIDPFAAAIKDGQLWGRGASDMKGGIAAFVGALSQLISSGWQPKGSISLLITGDEEGPAINGTKKVLQALAARGETIDHCLVGEPTNPDQLGEMVKIGRRGSLNGVITVTGTQGHVAYPGRAENPVPVLLNICSALTARTLDEGNEHFQPSNLEITSIDVGNAAHNVIAARAQAKFNIRFNTEHKGEDLLAWIEKEVATASKGFGGDVSSALSLPGRPFLTAPSAFTDHLLAAIEQVTGRRAKLSTSGGTSDARFICNYSPVAEFGLIGKTIHQVDEHAGIADIESLQAIYAALLKRYFA